MKTKLTVSFALLMIMFSTAIPGVYAMEDDSAMQMPEMNAEQMKERTVEMIDNSIDSLTTLQSELEDEDLLDSVDSLLEKMETLKTELEVTDDETEISAIMEEVRSSMEGSPEEIREALMQNGAMGGDKATMMGDESMQPPEGGFTGNGTMNGEAPISGEAPQDRPEDDAAGDESSSGVVSSEENNGLLSGLITFIKSLF